MATKFPDTKLLSGMPPLDEEIKKSRVTSNKKGTRTLIKLHLSRLIYVLYY